MYVVSKIVMYSYVYVVVENQNPVKVDCYLVEDSQQGLSG